MARAAARKKRAPIGSRTLVALGLAGLLGVSALVIWRRAIAVAENREVRSLEEKKRELISLRTTLERDLVEATSRQRIVPAAEKRLGMHVATELEVRNLPSASLRDAGDSVVRDSAARDTFVVDTLARSVAWVR
ncbi:MAG: hypothetical protein H7Z40_12625 [Phycisphaerae bacterium]|nr:hypothetical protein [Gemmatimonadaceae bacterium]